MPNEWTLTLEHLQKFYPDFPAEDWQSLCVVLDAALKKHMANYE